MEDTEIQELVERLGRPHRSGGVVIERAAIVAEGADFDAVMAWILQRGGEAEVAPRKAPARGIHAMRYHDTDGDAPPVPLRFILPRDAQD
jgi:hypothetical protein